MKIRITDSPFIHEFRKSNPIKPRDLTTDMQYWSKQVDSHNNGLEKSPKHEPQQPIKLKASEFAVDLQDQLESKLNKAVTLDDLKDMIEIDHPYHEVKVIPKTDEKLPSSLKMTHEEFLKSPYATDQAKYDVHHRKGVISSRLKSIEPINSIDKNKLGIIANIFHRSDKDLINKTENLDPEYEGTIERKLHIPKNKEDVSIEHDLFEVPRELQHKGFAEALLKKALPVYKHRLGLKKVDLYAALTGGVQAWAKFGGVFPETSTTTYEGSSGNSVVQENHVMTKHFLEHLQKHFMKNGDDETAAYIKANHIIENAKKEQEAEIIHSRNLDLTKEAHVKKLQDLMAKDGLHPYKVYGINIHNKDGSIYHAGHRFLANKGALMEIPLDPKAPTAHSYHIVKHFFPELEKQEVKEAKVKINYKKLVLEAIDDLLNQQKTRSVKVTLKNSPTLDVLKQKIGVKQNQLQNITMLPTVKEQIEAYKKFDPLFLPDTANSPEDLEKYIDHDSLSDAGQITPLSFEKMMHMYNYYMPYHTAKISLPLNADTVKLPDHIHLNNTEDLNSLVKQHNGTINNHDTGIMASYINHAFAEPNEADQTNIHVSGPIEHFPSDLNGSFLQKEFGKKKLSPEEDTVENDYITNKSGRFYHNFALNRPEAHIRHETMITPSTARGTGFGSDFFKRSSDFSKKLGLDHIAINAGYSNGGQAWAKAGGVIHPNPGEEFKHYTDESPKIFRDLEIHLPKLLKAHGAPKPFEAATKILKELIQKQEAVMQAAGHSKKYIDKFISIYGVDPYLIYNVKLQTPEKLLHVGHEFLAGRHYAAAIPLQKNSRFRRSLPYINAMHKEE